MSSPRYDWWPYVKGMIRRYPELCARQEELRRTKMSPNLTGMHGAHSQTSDPVADAALRELPEINCRELEAVRQAIEAGFLEEDAYIGRGSDGAALVCTKAGRMAWGVYTMCSEKVRAFIIFIRFVQSVYKLLLF